MMASHSAKGIACLLVALLIPCVSPAAIHGHWLTNLDSRHSPDPAPEHGHSQEDSDDNASKGEHSGVRSGDETSELDPRRVRKELRDERHAEVAEEQHEQMEERYERSNVANAIAIMLLGMLSFQISLFYMVNFPDEKIQHFTWSCLNTTISIFCALPTWTGIKALLIGITSHLTGESYDPEGLPQNAVDVLLPLSEFMFTFFVVHFLLLHSRHREEWFAALSTIGAHIIGFSAIDGFGSLQQAQPWRNSPFLSLCATLISIVAICMLCHWAASIFQSRADGGEEDSEWLEECNECGNEFAGFVIGQLVSQTVRFSIDGSLEPIEGFPWGKSRAQDAELFSVSMFFAAVLLIGTLAAQEMKRLIRRGEIVALNARFVEMFEEALAMSFGWCLLMAGRWLYWVSTNDEGLGEGDVMTARMVQALAFSFFVFASIFVVDFVAHRGFGTSPEDSHALRQLMRAFGLVLGLSWEGAFREATSALGRNFERPRERTAMQEGLGLFICVIVLPAWGMYILPVARTHKKKINDALHSRAKGSPHPVVKSMLMPKSADV